MYVLIPFILDIGAQLYEHRLFIFIYFKEGVSYLNK